MSRTVLPVKRLFDFARSSESVFLSSAVPSEVFTVGPRLSRANCPGSVLRIDSRAALSTSSGRLNASGANNEEDSEAFKASLHTGRIPTNGLGP